MSENYTVYDGWFYCHFRKAQFRWNEYIEYFKKENL